MGTLTLTSLIPSIQQAMDTVSSELVGFIPAVSRDSTAERAAVGQVVVSPVVGVMAAEDLAAAAYAAYTPNQTIGNVQMQITKSRSVPFGITGEETLGLRNAGTLGSINEQRIAQAMRTLTNEVEADLAALHVAASRAYGTYNGTPFATAADLSDFAQSLKILEDNGAPGSDLHMVMGGTCAANIRGKQATLFQINTGGAVAEDLLRRGALGSVQGFDLHQSKQTKTAVTTGTAANATTDNAGYAVGATAITLAAVGTGTLIPGDIISFAGDTNQYVVANTVSAVSGGALQIAEPGLRVAMSAATKAITVVAATTRNMLDRKSVV